MKFGYGLTVAELRKAAERRVGPIPAEVWVRVAPELLGVHDAIDLDLLVEKVHLLASQERKGHDAASAHDQQ